MKIGALLLFFSTLLCVSVFAESTIEIEKRVLAMKNFPCMKCHTQKDQLQVLKKMTFPLNKPHSELTFKHMPTVKNCYTCHNKDNLNTLHLFNKSTISFDQSYQLCSQCHGEKKRDWGLGIHGRQMGSWNEKKFRFTCVSCHDPHRPKFKQMRADPAPQHPNRKGGHHE